MLLHTSVKTGAGRELDKFYEESFKPTKITNRTIKPFTSSIHSFLPQTNTPENFGKNLASSDVAAF